LLENHPTVIPGKEGMIERFVGTAQKSSFRFGCKVDEINRVVRIVFWEILLNQKQRTVCGKSAGSARFTDLLGNSTRSCDYKTARLFQNKRPYRTSPRNSILAGAGECNISSIWRNG